MHTVGQKFVTTWGYVCDPLVFVVNKEIWASWTPADQAIVRQAAIDAGKQNIAWPARVWSRPTSRCSRTSRAWA